MNKQVAKLVLSTYGFVANSTNSIGYMDTYAQLFALFNLSLVEMASGVSVSNSTNDILNFRFEFF